MRMKFLLENVWKDLLGNKFISAVLLSVFFISNLTMLCAGNIVWNAWQDYRFSRISEAEKLGVAEFFIKENTLPILNSGYREKDVRAMLESGQVPGFKQMEFCSFMNLVVEQNGEAAVYNVQGSTQNFFEVCNYRIEEGAGFSALFENGHGCIIKAGRYLDNQGVSVGDILRINGESFEVLGIVRCPASYGEIFLTYEDFSLLAGVQRHQYQALYRYQEELSGRDLKKMRGALDKKVDLTEYCSGMEHQEIYRTSIVKQNRSKIFSAVMLFIIAAINFFVLVCGKSLLEKKRMGIRISIGAFEYMLFLESAVRMELIYMAAFLIAVMLYPSLFQYAVGIPHSVAVEVGAVVWLSNSILIFLVSGAVFARLCFRKTAIDLLRDRT